MLFLDKLFKGKERSQGSQENLVQFVSLSDNYDFAVVNVETIEPANLETALDRAQAKGVQAIVLRINSPGAPIKGIYNLAEKIRNSPVTIYAYVDEIAFSAAYWIASACKKIFLASPTAKVGGVGVTAIHENIKGMLKNMGVEVTEIAEEKWKRITSPFRELSEEARKELREQVSYLKDIFSERVRKYRSLDSTYESKIFIGQQALEKGFADEIITFDVLKTRLEKKMQKNDTNDLQEEAKNQADETTQGQVSYKEEAKSQASKATQEKISYKEEAKNQADETAQEENSYKARQEERTRVQKILSSCPQGYEEEAQSAISRGVSPQEFALEIMQNWSQKTAPRNNFIPKAHQLQEQEEKSPVQYRSEAFERGLDHILLKNQ